MSWLEAEAGGEALLLIMVADGHAGSEAAQISADNALPLVVSKTKDGSAASLQAALRCVCERLHSLVVSTSGTAGTTLTIVVWNAGRGELTICNLGDSAAVLVSATGHTLLTTDHRLSESPEEFERVRAAGARIGRVKRDGGIAGGPLRAWPGGLAVTRTIGDADCPYVSAVPALQTVACSPSSAAVVACSDGVWDALSHAQVAALVRECATATDAAERVTTKALKTRGLRDDITCVAVWLGQPPWAASAPPRKPKSLTFGRLFRPSNRGSSSQSSSAESSSGCTPLGPTPLPSPSASPMGSPVSSAGDLELWGNGMAGLGLEGGDAAGAPEAQESRSPVVRVKVGL